MKNKKTHYNRKRNKMLNAHKIALIVALCPVVIVGMQQVPDAVAKRFEATKNAAFAALAQGDNARVQEHLKTLEAHAKELATLNERMPSPDGRTLYDNMQGNI